MITPTHLAYIGLGANSGNSQASINTALTQLGMLPGAQLIRYSSLYLSAPLDADGDDYVNAVAELRTQQTPMELLAELQQLETQSGRLRPYRNAPRTLDLDLLLYDQDIINSTDLHIPHPRMTQRAFVIVPLLEIAPDIVIPQVGSARDLLPGLRNQVIRKMVC